MHDYLKGQLMQITEELNNLVYDHDRQYYNELILRHRTITNVIYMTREYNDVDIFVSILKDKIRLEQLAMRTYTKRYFANDINYEDYSYLLNESEIVTGIYSEVIEFIDLYK